MPIAVVVLAAGQGTRMNSDLPKVLHPLAGFPLLAHAMRTAASLEPERLVVVAGHRIEAVSAAAGEIDETVIIAHQIEQRGTGHAVMAARAALAGFTGDAAVLFGDTPFVRPETLERMRAARAEGADVVVLGFETEAPGGYGRLIRTPDGALSAIVEARDAGPPPPGAVLCNSGVMLADCATLFALLDAVEPQNAQGEYYLTDIVALAHARGLSGRVVTCPEAETLGINSRADLASAESTFQAAARAAAMENGATLTDPATVWFALDTAIGRDVVIAPNVVFGPEVTVESGATIHAFCHLEGCHVSRGAKVGPFARLRPGAELAEDVHVGNFVEIKNAILAEGAKANHLTYIGDADIGAGSNIGAGTITCNYDGEVKHPTRIGDGAFVGSDSTLVAPIEVGQGAYVAAGSTLTEDVEPDALALGRSRQVVKPGWARRRRARRCE
jgi:bifunctional UDP-N-acetylglucosamine pyrophosphorylase/glucosamine-1-phosphate N-acetyltransferase